MKTSPTTAAVIVSSFFVLGFHPALAESVSSTTVLTVPDTNITSIAPNFDIDVASGLSGIRTEISTENSAYEDVNASDSRVHYSTVDGLRYDPETQAVTFEANGVTTICGHFTDDRRASRKGIKELVNNSDGTIKKPIGSNHIEYVDGSRKGEKIFFETPLFEKTFFIPTGNCTFSVRNENKTIVNAFKSKSVDYKSIVFNVHPAGK